MPERVAFIGLGIMGEPMAGHLLKAGHALTVHSRTRSRADDLLERGATWALSPAEAAERADFVFICVPDTPDVEEVVLGENGVARVARTGQVVIDHSTISPTVTRRIAESLLDHGVPFLDAPVSGGDSGARSASLSIMVGGEEPAFSRALPLLKRMGKTITHCGVSGNGQLTKLVNQILVAVTNLAVCEAITFATENGLDLPKTLTAVGGGAAGSWQLANLGPKMIAGDFAPGFMIKLQVKDLRLALKAAEDRGLTLPATSLVGDLFARALDEGRGREGTQALFAVVEETARKVER